MSDLLVHRRRTKSEQSICDSQRGFSRRIRRAFVPCIVAIMLLGRNVSVLADTHDTTLVHPGDRLTITVLNHPEMLTQVTVSSTGTVSVPLAGSVDVNGCDVAKAGKRIEDRLHAYLRFPAVDVAIIQPAGTVYVVGWGGGALPGAAGEPLAAAVAPLITSQNVDIAHVTLVRRQETVGTYDLDELKRTGDGGPTLEAEDRIVLRSKAIAVMVRGDVKTPGPVYLDSGETLADALNQAGGPLPDAATGAIKLTRTGSVTRAAYASSEFNSDAHDADIIDVFSAVHVSVAGAVTKPGDVSMIDGTTLIAALYDAGGPTRVADLNRVAVLHQGVRSIFNVPQAERGASNENPVLSNGDLIFVPTGHRIDAATIFGGLDVVRFFVPPI